MASLTVLAQGEGGQELTPVQQLLSNPFLPIVGLFFLYYFIVLAPERRRKREDAKMKSALKKNDRIITIGGIHGVVATAPGDSNVVTIRLDDAGTTKMRINRSAISTIVNDKTGSGTSDTEMASESK